MNLFVWTKLLKKKNSKLAMQDKQNNKQNIRGKKTCKESKTKPKPKM
jgi:hypothetical protein